MTHEPLPPLTCRQFVEIVTDYLEQQLDEARKLWTDAHLAECDACRAYLEQMQQTIRALRGLADERLDDARRDRILEMMRDARLPAS